MQPVWPFLAAINSACNHNAWLQASGEKVSCQTWITGVCMWDGQITGECGGIGRLLFEGGWAEVGGDDKHL